MQHLEAPERLPREIDPDTLRKYFTLTETDLTQLRMCSGAANKIGFAVQLCTLRWRGHFLRDTRELPWAVLETITEQLGLLPISITDYPRNEKTRFEHLDRIREHLGFARCDEPQRQRLLDHLIVVAEALPRATALRHEARRWLQEEKVVRPGRTTLRDLIRSARETALQQVYGNLTNALTVSQKEQIDSLLVVSASDREEEPPSGTGPWSRSSLEQIKSPPRKESSQALLALIERMVGLRSFGLATTPLLAVVYLLRGATNTTFGICADLPLPSAMRPCCASCRRLSLTLRTRLWKCKTS